MCELGPECGYNGSNEPDRLPLESPSRISVDSGAAEWLKVPQNRVVSDAVNSPDHYRWLPVEAIEITENFNFCMGNALKYILRADHKGKPVEDLRKSLYYIRRELKNRGYTENA